MYQLITAKDMTPKELKRNVEAANRWAESGLARKDICNRCGKYYQDESPECVNTELHKRLSAVGG